MNVNPLLLPLGVVGHDMGSTGDGRFTGRARDHMNRNFIRAGFFRTQSSFPYDKISIGMLNV